MAESALLKERDGHLLILTLNRPEKKNPFNPEILCKLCDAYDEIDADDDIRCAILTGAGGNFIEPLDGRPRIVQGTVLAIDPTANEVLLDLVVPIRLEMFEGQSAGEFATGEMVNFYMHPGATFTPDSAEA